MINATICNICKHIAACYVVYPYNSNVIYHLVQKKLDEQSFSERELFLENHWLEREQKGKNDNKKLGRKPVNQFLEKNVLHRVIYM